MMVLYIISFLCGKWRIKCPVMNNECIVNLPITEAKYSVTYSAECSAKLTSFRGLSCLSAVRGIATSRAYLFHLRVGHVTTRIICSLSHQTMFLMLGINGRYHYLFAKNCLFGKNIKFIVKTINWLCFCWVAHDFAGWIRKESMWKPITY